MLPRKVRGVAGWLAPAREPVVQDPEVETLRPGAAAEESAVTAVRAETRVLPAVSPADHMRLDTALLEWLAKLQVPPEWVSE